MRAVNPSTARCSVCAEAMDHGFYDVPLRIRAIPETGDDARASARGKRASTGEAANHPYSP